MTIDRYSDIETKVCSVWCIDLGWSSTEKNVLRIVFQVWSFCLEWIMGLLRARKIIPSINGNHQIIIVPGEISLFHLSYTIVPRFRTEIEKFPNEKAITNVPLSVQVARLPMILWRNIDRISVEFLGTYILTNAERIFSTQLFADVSGFCQTSVLRVAMRGAFVYSFIV